jgi:dihydroflavonol-4-reductase
MRIAIVGATGMIGYHTAREALARGHEVLVIHRASSNLSGLRELAVSTEVASLEEPASLVPALRKVNAVIHCAAYYPTKPSPWRREVDVAAAQIGGFFDAAKEARLERIVYLGAAIALPRDPAGKPGTEALAFERRPEDRTPYVQVKYEMDRIARERAAFGLPVVIGIPAMCFGDHDRGPTTGQLIVDVANRVLPGYIRGNRNVIYAGDAGRGLVLACEKGRAGERYLFTGANVTMDELVPIIARVAGVPAPSRVIPLGVARALSWLQETRYRLFGGPLPKISATAIAVLASGQFLDGAKAERELGFKSEVSVEEAVERAFRWFVANGYVRRGSDAPPALAARPADRTTTAS